MKKKWLLSLLAASLLPAAACKPARPSSSDPANPDSARLSNSAYSGQAQPKLRVIRLWLGANELKAEVARSASEIATGMMHRTKMAEDEAMLFVFPKPRRASFYMRNTILPLSCAYIGSDGAILEIHDMKPLDETPIIASTDQVQYVLEVNQGWFKSHRVGIGTVVSTEKGPLRKIFFGQ